MKALFIFVFSFISINLIALGNLPTDKPKMQSDAIKVDELAVLDSLMNATQKSLQEQIKIKKLINNYQDLQKKYLQSSDNETLLKLIKTAHAALESIKENHLIQIFPPDFITELNRFSAVAAKKGIPKPEN